MMLIRDKEYLLQLCHAYFYAKKYVINKGYAQEVDWQNEVNLKDIDAATFLRESAWVILSSGFSEKIIAKMFSSISKCFYDWQNISLIIKNKQLCFDRAYNVFSNERKIRAIISTVDMIHSLGFETIKHNIENEGIEYLETLPYIGSITKYHLAKNIGLNYSKPDRHLKRISEVLGFASVQNLCSSIAFYTSEKESVIDLVIWRYATLNSDYLKFLRYYLKKGKDFN